jgi:hypothetical protein
MLDPDQGLNAHCWRLSIERLPRVRSLAILWMQELETS